MLPRRVVVINVHGGVPAALIEAVLQGWSSCRTLRERGSDVRPRVYTTNACAAASLHDMLTGTPCSGLTDAVWYSWSRTGATKGKSIFQAMRERTYRTRLIGAFGLDAALDPHRNVRPHPFDVRHALDHFGVDEFDEEDAAFAFRSAGAHDAEAIERLGREVCSWQRSDERHFCVVNLLGCRDLERLCWRDGADYDAHVPCVDALRWLSPPPPGVDEEKRIGASVLYDDCRARASTDDPYRRIGMLYDRLRGERSDLPTRERTVRVVCTLQSIAWAMLRRLDECLLPVLEQILKEEDASVAIGCDQPIGLYEHGAMGGAPWEACCRGFLVLSSAETRARATSLTLPLACSTTVIARWLLGGAAPAVADGPVTISIAPSNLGRATVEPRTDPFALLAFWARAVVHVASRTYVVVYWWSLDDLVMRTTRAPTAHGASARRSATLLAPGGLSEWMHLDHATRAERVAERDTWRLPLDDDRHMYAVYDLTTDREEMVNLLVAEQLEGTELLRLVAAESRRLLEAHGLIGRDVAIRFPRELHRMSLDYLTTDAIRVRRGMAVDRRAPRSVHVQTDATVHFTRAQTTQYDALPTPPPPPLAPERPRRPTSVMQLEKGRTQQHR